MDSLKTVLVANRGEIAARLIKTARRLGIRTVAIYSEPDSASAHVSLADKACLLQGPPSSVYLDIDQIIEVARENNVDAVIPGYGFLSENHEFAKKLASNGLVFVGPDSETIQSFGLKHTARDLAIRAGVPVVPGSQGLLETEAHAIEATRQLGLPVMLKATAGGGGMGLLTCYTEEEVRSAFQTVQSRGSALFRNSGVFVEKYYPKSHHIEVQIFGNGMGDAISIGERECSIQRRHQKVIEECPSPFVEQRYPHLRQALSDAATSLARLVKYSSVGTIEFLVDDKTGAFFFLEANTRLQVEHGITEMCYGVDLVELMYRQADAQISGRSGVDAAELEQMQQKFLQPQGHAIELRLCAENPARGYAPSPGVLQQVVWHVMPETRIDTWIRTGLTVTNHYDSLLAKIMHRAPSRSQAIRDMIEIASNTIICGPANNLDFMISILKSPEFTSGNTITNFLSQFQYSPTAIDVISGGAYTLIQDYPGRPTVGHGFGHAGPMDPVAFKIANELVGNGPNVEGLEITMTGPELRFLGDAVVSLCGPLFEANLDSEPFPAWTMVRVSAGQTLRIGKCLAAGGCRAYLAVRGGFTNVGKWFGSKATCPGVSIGGYQGRALKAGDFLSLTPLDSLPVVQATVPESARPQYSGHWDIAVMGGPFEEGYLQPADSEMLYSSKWKVSHNAARGGVRLIGPRPKWARSDGGEGGSHPSNMIEYGYPIGGLNWTGDEPVILPMDGPDFGGFACSLTVIEAELWKVGQLKPGDTLQFHRISLEDALDMKRHNIKYVQDVASSTKLQHFDGIIPPSAEFSDMMPTKCVDPAVVRYLEESAARPRVTYRQGGDNYLLIEYGEGSFNLNHKCRATTLDKKLRAGKGDITFETGLLNIIGCGNSLQIYYDGLKIPQVRLVDYLVSLENELGDLRDAKLPNRTFSLPLTFTHARITEAMERYMSNQRPYASYLPDNFKFLARNNGISHDELKRIFLEANLVAVGVGFVMALPECLPADPRHRLASPKMNPSRTFTPEGAVSWGGSCMAMYNADGPGGYMIAGMSIPGVDVLGYKNGYSEDRPWLFDHMDVINFYEVTEEEYDREIALWKSGRYQYRVQDTVFDMTHHNQLLSETAEEVVVMRAKQKEHQAKMIKLESELLMKWGQERAADKPPIDQLDQWLHDPNYVTLDSPVNANVWKVQVSDGEILSDGSVAAILEAMKLEISIMADAKLNGCVVEKVLVRPGDSIEAGKPILVGRKAIST